MWSAKGVRGLSTSGMGREIRDMDDTEYMAEARQNRRIIKLVFKKTTPAAVLWLQRDVSPESEAPGDPWMALDPEVEDERFDCHLDLVLRYQLEKDMLLTPAVYEQLRQDQLALELRHKALNYHYARTRTVAEVRRFLQGKNAPPDWIEEILLELAENHGLEDEKAVLDYIEQKRGRLGPVRLRHELLRRGAAPGLVDQALASLNALHGEDEIFEAALALAQKKLAGEKDTDLRKAALRVVGLLQRRGYTPEMIRRVARALDLKLY